jgi:hypothetical protein
VPGRRDVGADLLADRIASQADSNGGGGLQIFAQLSATLGRVAAALETQAKRDQQLWQAIRPIPGIPIPQITTTSGIADYPELLSPRTGYWWFVIQAAAVTFSGGSVNLYRNSANVDSLIVGAFTAAGYLTYSSSGLPVSPNQRLIFAAQTVTGNVTPSLSTVVEVADWAVPAYLM